MKIKYGSMLCALTILISGTLAFGSRPKKNLPVAAMMRYFEATNSSMEKRMLLNVTRTLRDISRTGGNLSDEQSNLFQLIGSTESQPEKNFLNELVLITYNPSVKDYSQLNTLVQRIQEWYTKNEGETFNRTYANQG